MRKIMTAIALGVTSLCAPAYTLEPIRFGNMDQWVTRTIHESAVIGGHNKTLYEIGPNATLTGNNAYSPQGGSPWATSNVYARVKGITKGSNMVFPEARSGNGRCARLYTDIETVKVLGIINMDVMVSGSIFLGRMFEPITSTSNPYAKMEMGMPYTKRPKALVFDYRVEMPASNERIRSTGWGRKRHLQGRDQALVFVMLQRRWEDSDGNIHAKRVASGYQKFGSTTPWHNGHAIPLYYGDISGTSHYDPILALRQGDLSYYARNSRGRLVKIQEEGWDSADATPTHVIVMASAGAGEAYVGTPGLTFYVDNFAFGF